MEYKTGDMAKLVGLTSQTLREYENSGLIEADKNSESGYRYFQSLMVSKTIAIRHLRNMGFSISEVGELFQKMEYSDYVQRFENVLELQEKNLEKQKLLCELTKRHVDLIRNAEQYLHQCKIEENVSFYCLDYVHAEKPLLKTKNEFAVMDEWTKNSFFTRNYSPLKADMTNGHTIGLAVEKNIAKILELPVHEPVFERNYSKAITMLTKHTVDQLPGDEELAYIKKYAQENNLSLGVDPFLISCFTFWEGDKEVTCSMMYYPVKNC